MKIKKWQIIYLLLLFPYFELGSVTVLEQNEVLLFQILGKLYTIARIMIDAYVIISFVKNKRLPNSKVAFLLIVYCFSGFAIQLLHMNISIRIILGLFNNLSLVFIFFRLLKKERIDYLKTILLFFGGLSIVGAFSIILNPYGINNSLYFDDAIWFLGTKNGNGEYFLIFLLALLLYRDKMKLKIKDYLVAILFLYCVIRCHSANSTVCIAAVLLYMLFRRFWSWIAMYIDHRIVLLATGTAIICIIASTWLPGIIYRLILALGKDINFTGRRVLWEQAIRYFLDNPLIGSGGKIIYSISDIKIEPHAHSMYLDSLAKAGVFPLMIFVWMIIASLDMYDRKEKVTNATKILFVVIFMIHMAFEDLPIPFVIVIFMLIGSRPINRSRSFSYDDGKAVGYAYK